MGLTKYHNIDGSTGVSVELLALNSGVSGLKSISIVNTHASNAGTISLFIQVSIPLAAPKTFYIIKTVTLPVGATLFMDDKSMVTFDNSKYALYATVGSSDTIDISLKFL